MTLPTPAAREAARRIYEEAQGMACKSDHEIKEGIARIIDEESAAPQLLESLRECLDGWVDQMKAAGWARLIDDMPQIKRARAAIKAATE